MMCVKCAERIAMSACSTGNCVSCGKQIFSGSTPCNVLCEECSIELSKCEHCGEKLRER